MAEKKVIIEIDIDAKKAVHSVDNLNKAIKEQNAILKKSDAGSDAYKQAEKNVAKLTTSKNILVKATKEEVRIAELTKKAATATKGSYDQLSAQYSLNTIALNKMSQAEKETTDKGKKLVSETKKIRESMSAAKKATGDHRLEVGNYKITAEALNEKLKLLQVQEGKLNVEVKRSKVGFKQASKEVKDFKSATTAQTQAVKTASIGYKTQAQKLKEVKAQIKTTRKELKASAPVANGYSSALKGVGTSFTKIFTAAGLANLATQGFTMIISGIKQFLGGSTDAFIRQENAVTKLKFALDSNIQTLGRYKERASEIQKQTVFGDESILEVQGYAAALNLSEKQTNSLVDASIQLATVTGKDLRTSSELLAKTFTGEVSISLKNHLIGLKDLSKEQIENGGIVDQLKEKYKGFAEAQALTSVGALQQLKNELGDTQEELGKYTIQAEIYWEKVVGLAAQGVVQNVKAISDIFSGFSNSIDEATVKIKEQRNAIAGVITAYSGLTKTTVEQNALQLRNAKNMTEILQIYGKMTAAVNKANEAGEDEVELTEEQIAAAKKAADEKYKKLNELEKLRIELMDEGVDKEQEAEKLRYKNYIKQWGESEDALLVHTKNLLKIVADYEDAKEEIRLEEEKKEQEAQDKKDKKQVEDLEKSLEQIEKDNDAIDKRMDEWRAEEIAKEQKDKKEKLDIAKAYGAELGDIVNASIDESGLNIKLFGKNLLVFMLDILKKQAQTAIATAVVGSFATPQSVATGGTMGVVQGALLTGLIEAAFRVAKGVISRPPQGLATGTPQVTQGGRFVVGEQGPEMVSLPVGAAVIPNSLMDFAGFGNFAAPQTNTPSLTVNDLKQMRFVVYVDDISKKQNQEATRVEVGKV